MIDTHDSLWSELTHLYSTQGPKAAIKRVVWPIFAKLAGTNELREQVAALYYFLKHCVDIRNAPKATGPLRRMQEADAALLWLCHEICVRNGLTYWSHAGTLLGRWGMEDLARG